MGKQNVQAEKVYWNPHTSIPETGREINALMPGI